MIPRTIVPPQGSGCRRVRSDVAPAVEGPIEGRETGTFGVESHRCSLREVVIEEYNRTIPEQQAPARRLMVRR
jgi:hypothetical protein